MFDPYKIAVKVTLANEVSAGLVLMSGQFTAASAKAEIFAAKLKAIKSLAIVGGGMLFAGIIGFDMTSKLVKPALEYQHQLNILHIAGLSQIEINEAVAASWKNTSDVITTSATNNMKSFIDMRNVLGNTQEALSILPMVTKMQAVLMSSKEGAVTAESSDFAFNVAKALDIIGAAKNPVDFVRQATEMSKVVTALQGRVTPQQFQMVFAYARQAKLALDDEFKYKYLPSLMLEYSRKTGGGGGSRGVGPMLAATYRFTNQGYINKKSLPELVALGLVDPNSALTTTTTGTTVGAMKGADLAARDPYLWVQQVVMPAIYKRLGKNASFEAIQQEINEITRGNQLAASAISEYALKSKNFNRDANIIEHALPVDAAYKLSIANDPALAFEALDRQMDNLKTALALPIASVIIPSLMYLTTGLNKLSIELIKYPYLSKILIYSFVGLSASLTFGGIVILLTAAFKGLALALSVLKYPVVALAVPLIGISAGFVLVAANAYMLYETIKKIDFTPVLKGLESVYELIAKFIHTPLSMITKLKDLGNDFFKENNANKSKSSAQTISPNNKSNQAIHVHTQVNLDGSKVGTMVSKHIATSQTKVPNNTSRFDTAMHLSPVIATLFSAG